MKKGIIKTSIMFVYIFLKICSWLVAGNLCCRSKNVVPEPLAMKISLSEEIRDIFKGLDKDLIFELDVTGSDAGDDIKLSQIVSQCPQLRTLIVRESLVLTGDFLAGTPMACPFLCELTFCRCPRLDVANFQYLPDSLQSFKVLHCIVSLRETFWRLNRQCPRLQEFSFCGNESVSDKPCKKTEPMDFAMLPAGLEKISFIAVAAITDATLFYLGNRCQGLQSLNISFCPGIIGTGFGALPGSLRLLFIGDRRRIWGTYVDSLMLRNRRLRVIDNSFIDAIPAGYR